MKLVRYNPLNDFVPGTFGDLLENVLQSSNNNGFYPAVDVIKGEKEFTLLLEAPGMEKSDFNIDLEEKTLTISGERKRPEGVNYTQLESNYGHFKRTFKLNDLINREKITAEYNNGILKVTLPVTEDKKIKNVITVK